MTDTPYLTRARETLRRLFPKGSPFAQAELAEKLAAEFAQVTNDALERAAKEADEFYSDRDGGDAAHVIALNIRSLKVSP